MRMVAIVLIVVGILAVGYQGFTYVTRDKVVDIGPIEITKEDTKTVALPPIIGALVLVGGVVLLVTTAKKA